MSSDAGAIPTGYRQPAQARAFGRATVIAVALLVLLALGIGLASPPMAAVDAGRAVAFVVESIPLDRTEDRPRPVPADPAASVAPAPPSPAAPRQAAPLPQRAMPTAVPAAVTAPSTSVATTPPATSGSAARAAPVPAPAAPAAAAVPPAAAGASAAADWRARLLGHLKRFRRYPRQAEAARQQGVVRLTITLRRSGDVVAVDLARGSGSPLLDMEARATVRRASPLPPPDDAISGDPVTVEVPIDFALRR